MLGVLPATVGAVEVVMQICGEEIAVLEDCGEDGHVFF